MRLSNTTQRSITIEGVRYNRSRIIKDLCREKNEAGNFWLNEGTEIRIHDRETGPTVEISAISGEFAIIED